MKLTEYEHELEYEPGEEERSAISVNPEQHEQVDADADHAKDDHESHAHRLHVGRRPTARGQRVPQAERDGDQREEERQDDARDPHEGVKGATTLSHAKEKHLLKPPGVSLMYSLRFFRRNFVSHPNAVLSGIRV